MLVDALEYPTRGESWLKTVLIGGVLLLLGFLIVPLIAVQGYMLRVLRGATEDAEEPPVFDEWEELLVDGVKVIGASFVFLLVPFVIAAAAVVFGGFAAFSGSEGSGIVGLLLALLAFVGWLLAAYLLPAGLANMAREESFAAAFDVDVLRTVGSSTDYLVAVALAFVIAAVLGSVASALSAVLVGVFVLFYLQVSVFYLYGRGFSEAMEGEPEPTSTVGGARPTE